MKVLLTGATGYVGGHVGHRLLQEGHEVVALTRSKARAKLDFRCKVVEVQDLLSVSGVEAVIHLAGASVAEKRWTTSYKNTLRHSRVDFTKEVLSRLDLSELRVWVQASGVGLYQESCSKSIVETSKVSQGFLGQLVQDWEGVSSDLSCRKVYFRMGMVVGPRAPALKKMEPLFSKGLGSVLGSGKQFLPWVHVEDVVRGFVQALTDVGLQGAYNMVAPSQVSNKGFTQAYKKALGVKFSLPPAPAFVLRFILGDMSQILLDSLPVWPQSLLRHQGWSFQHTDLLQALKGSV